MPPQDVTMDLVSSQMDVHFLKLATMTQQHFVMTAHVFSRTGVPTLQRVTTMPMLFVMMATVSTRLKDSIAIVTRF